jgi:hypothetical protein
MKDTSPENPLEPIRSLREIRRFHPSFRPHFLDSPDQDLQPRSINVFVGRRSRILIAAPHGYKKDDLNTEILAHALARELRASMVINNQKYRKPRAPHLNDPEIRRLAVSDPILPSSRELGVREELIRQTSAIPVDLNRWPDAMIAAPDFFHPLTAISNTICQESAALVIFVHGIADRNRSGDRNPDFVVGAGYEYSRKREAFRSGRTTASEVVVNDLISALRELKHDSRPAWVEEGLPGYAAEKRIRLPWVFSMLSQANKGTLAVEAIQLEIRHEGFRELQNIPATAVKLATVLRSGRLLNIQ